MADNPPIKESFNLGKWFSGIFDPVTWSKSVMYLIMGAVIVLIVMAIWNFFFPTKAIVNKPHALVIGKAEKGAIDQTSTNIVVQKEPPFEVGVGAGVLRYDSKDGYFGGVFGKWKF